MSDSQGEGSPLEGVAGSVGPRAIEAFKLVGNETRLAILVTLWEAYDPHTQENAVSFTQLREMVGTRDSGQFNYHLDQLVDRFVAKTDDGYVIQNPGLKIVKAVIAGSGIENRTLQPSEIPTACPLCDATVEFSYEDEHLYHTCTACQGVVPPHLRDELPSGTLVRTDFSPAGLTNRTPAEVFVAGTIDRFGKFASAANGNCPECSGAVDASLRLCNDHDAATNGVCRACGTVDEVRVRHVCSVCKWWGFLPPEAVVHNHPAVVSFCYEQGIETAATLDGPEACGRLWDHLNARDHTLESDDPVRIRVTVPGREETLSLRLDGDLTVIDVGRAGE